VKEHKPSGTALAIAAALVMLHADPHASGLVSDLSAEFALESLKTCSGKPRWILSMLGTAWFRRIAELLQSLTVSGIVRHYALRKKCIDRLARDAVTAGATQAVVLGAGFDALAANLGQQFDRLLTWELDHPATQRCKASVLAKKSIASVRLIPADLSTIGPEAVLKADSKFQIGRPTAWIAEGLLMYFTAANVSRIFYETAEMSAAGSRFIFTFMRPGRDNRLRFDQQTPLIDFWLRFGGEPFRWGAAPEELPMFIKPWRVSQIFGSSDLRQMCSLQANERLAVGEMICLAEL